MNFGLIENDICVQFTNWNILVKIQDLENEFKEKIDNLIKEYTDSSEKIPQSGDMSHPLFLYQNPYLTKY